jgi:hypothetical protein
LSDTGRGAFLGVSSNRGTNIENCTLLQKGHFRPKSQGIPSAADQSLCRRDASEFNKLNIDLPKGKLLQSLIFKMAACRPESRSNRENVKNKTAGRVIIPSFSKIAPAFQNVLANR